MRGVRRLTRCCLQLPSLPASNEDLLAPGAAQRRRQVPRLNRATRGKREPPSDAEIERGLRERAVNSARDAEVLLRWRQTVRPPETTPGVDLESLSEAQLERLYAGLVRLATMDENELAALVEHVLAGDDPGSS
jgi:hypothetical protein